MRFRAVLFLALASLPLWAGAASAAPERPAVDIVEVPGVLDPPFVNYLRDEIAAAQKDNSALILIELDSAGALDVPLSALLRQIADSKVPVAVWVGPRKARAASGAAMLLAAAHIPAMGTTSSAGPIHPADLTISGSSAALREQEQQLLRLLPNAQASNLLDRRLSAQEALREQVVKYVTPTLADLLKQLDGQQVTTGAGPVTLHLKSADVDVRFHKPGPIRRFLHVLTSASLVYLFILIGAGLIAFELFQPGFGVAGVTGGLMLAGAGYGVLVLPVAWWALGVLLLGLVLLTLDVARDSLGVFTIGGTLATLIGSLGLFRVAVLRPPLWFLIAGPFLALVYFVPVMTVVRRARRPVGEGPTRALVGEAGEVRSVLNPEGFVWVAGGLWRARSGDGSKVRVGEAIEVIALDGPVLTVRRPV